MQTSRAEGQTAAFFFCPWQTRGTLSYLPDGLSLPQWLLRATSLVSGAEGARVGVGGGAECTEGAEAAR